MGDRTSLLRAGTLGAAGATAALAAALLLQSEGWGPVAALQALIVAVATFWLAFGAALVVLGLRPAPPAAPEAEFCGRAVVLMPVYNEDPGPVFASLQAMEADLRRAGLAERIHIAVLSDTRSEEMAAREEAQFARLLVTTGGVGRLFYRRRTDNRGRKAGNIADFIRRSGGAYDYAVILDADSLMSAATIHRMLRRLAADPRLGLLQSVPAIAGARSRFGRMIAFSGAFHGPVFARGLSRLQGDTGPFWGHNAAIRVRAFAQSCGLPELSGKPPFGGHVLSHDYVEAALLARAGWTVRLDPDLGESYEQGPENILAYAKRDRRWCQGNLQHGRLLLAPRLRPWSRFVFLQGIFAYLTPLLWIGLVLLSLLGDAEARDAGPLVALVVALLFGPKVLVTLASLPRAPAFGGPALLGASLLTEILQSALVAPILLMFQARSVLQVALGRDGGWPAQARGDGTLGWSEGWRGAWWIALWGAGLLAGGLWLTPGLVPWLLPMAGPMLLAPAVVTVTSRPSASALLATPEELDPAPILRLAGAQPLPRPPPLALEGGHA